jgi:hypothetical protein
MEAEIKNFATTQLKKEPFGKESTGVEVTVPWTSMFSDREVVAVVVTFGKDRHYMLDTKMLGCGLFSTSACEWEVNMGPLVAMRLGEARDRRRHLSCGRSRGFLRL